MSKQMKMNAQLDQMRRDGMSIDGDNAYKRDLLNAITGALAFGKQRSTPPPVGHWLEPFYEMGKAEADERDAARSLPVGVQDGYALVPVEPTPEIRQAIDLLCDDHRAFDDSEAFWQYLLDSAPAAPTVKAEQVPTPEFVWVQLLEALAGYNGCSFSASTDDYREAKPALVELIAAGFFRDAADSLDGDIWMVAAGEQGEAAARFASCADAYAVLSGVLNRVFERPGDAPSLPAAGSAGEELEWARHGISEAIELIDCISRHPANRIPVLDQARAVLVKALSAQQSAPVTKELAALAEQVQCCLPTQKERALPAAGSAVEEVEVVAWRYRHSEQEKWQASVERKSLWEAEPLMTVAQHKRIVATLRAQVAERDAAIEEWSGTAVQNGMEVDRLNAALSAQQSAQQSAPERVSVPVELLNAATSEHDSIARTLALRELRALLAGTIDKS